jgi:hypothetical protein
MAARSSAVRVELDDGSGATFSVDFDIYFSQRETTDGKERKV